MSYLFEDEFNGPKGPPDPSKWWATPWCSSSSDDRVVCYNPANAYVDGNGHLALVVSSGTMGRPYDGARVQTFQEGSWPPPKVLASIAPPVHIEASIKFAGGPGMWGGFWPMGINSTNPIEIDITEFRGVYPTWSESHVHNVIEWAGKLQSPSDLTQGFHIYACEYYTDHIKFLLDGVTVGTCKVRCSQKVGIRLDNIVGPPGTWGGEGGPPPASDIPGIMLVDWVRAWRL